MMHMVIYCHTKKFFLKLKEVKVKEAGGYSRIKTIIDGIKKESPNTLF